MRALFTLAIFVGSALLFLVQPMIAKMILPKFGGAPAVWTASLLFFQASLLLGYLYTHATSRLAPRLQSLIHVGLLALAVATLPFAIPSDAGAIGADNPTFSVLRVLAMGVGLPFILVSAGAPMLQRWFSRTGDSQAHDPYFLYSASNAGSMLGLLSYPFLVEPILTLKDQAHFWKVGYIVLAILLLSVALIGVWRPTGTADNPVGAAAESPRNSGSKPWLWILLAAVPASLLTGVTNYVTSNVTPMPLLWVAPLSLYLLSYILAFSRKGWSAAQLGRWLPIAVAPLALVLVLEASSPLIPLVILHLAVFFLAAWMCHRRLAESRPSADQLTAFYLWISVGGVLGGAFNALLAPVIFKTLAEYPIALVLALLLRPAKVEKGRFDLIYPAGLALLTLALVLISRSIGYGGTQAGTMIAIGVPVILAFFAGDRPIRFGLAIGAVLLVSNLMGTASTGKIVFTDRSFFGVHRVSDDGASFSLTHGTTRHGRQFKDPGRRGIPLTYYTRSGPIGRVFAFLNKTRPPKDVALIGLGVGTLATYGRQGQNFTYFEIDPVVDRIAHDPRYFTYLRDSNANLRVVLGDARLTLNYEQDASYDLIILDAFSSDAIPIHLLTKEAVAGYLKKLRPGGMLAFHISNNYLDLRPVLANVAGSLGLQARYDDDTESPEEGGEASVWAVMGADLSSMDKALSWSTLVPNPGAQPWTDDYSNLIGAWKHADSP